MEIDLVKLFLEMGWFGRGIAVVMGVMSVVSLLVFAERLLHFTSQRGQSLGYAAAMGARLSAEHLDDVAGAQVPASGYLGRVIDAGLRAFARSRDDTPTYRLESVARALERQSQREVASLRRGHAVLSTVAGIAPFVGLLGTVLGIVDSFRLMAASGSGGLASISHGIAEALVMTGFGLVVAIPAVAAANYVQAWVDARAVDLAESSNELLDEVARRLQLSRAG